MKSLVTVVSAATALLLLASACGDGKEADEGHYENAELGFAFDYPDEWQQLRGEGFQEAVVEPVETVASIVVGEPPGEGEQLHGMLVTVNVNNLETEKEISQAILGLDDLMAQAFAQVAGSEVRETDSAELAGMPARRYLIDFEFEGSVPSTSEQLIAPTPGLTFQLFCEAPRERFAEIRTGCQMVIESFEFTLSPQGQPAASAAPTEGATSTPGAPSTGKIAFVSDRTGNGDIYVIDSDGTGLARLTDNPANDHDAAWSPDGTRIAFAASTLDLSIEIYVMNADGSGLTNLTDFPGFDPAWSPDGSRIAFTSNRDGNFEIYVMDADGTGLTNLTKNLAWDAQPVWSPDGRRIAFMSERDSTEIYGNIEIYIINANGSGLTNLTNSPAWDGRPDWSPDGSRIAFRSLRDGDGEIYIMNADGTDLANLTKNPALDDNPAWSPDGTRIAFNSDRQGNAQVYVMNADGTGLTNLSTGAGPAWSPDGSRIAFYSPLDDNFEIYVMNADGSGVIRLTDNPELDLEPAWSPAP